MKLLRNLSVFFYTFHTYSFSHYEWEYSIWSWFWRYDFWIHISCTYLTTMFHHIHI